MSDRIGLMGAAVSILLLIVVLELVRRRRLTAEYSFVWILASLALLGLSFSRPLIAILPPAGLGWGLLLRPRSCCSPC